MQRAIRLLNDRLSDLGAVAIIVAATVIAVDVFSRMFFNAPFQGTADLVGLSLLTVTFLQAPKAIATGRLLRLSVLTSRFPVSWRNRLDVLAYAIGAAVFLALAITAYGPTIEAYHTREFFGTDAFRITAWPIRSLILVLWLCAAASFALCMVFGTDESHRVVEEA